MCPELDQYITIRYPRWLDYAAFHATLARFPDLSVDVLHTVLLNICEKPEDKLLSLYQRKKEGYTELDYYILKMIKLNCHSKTSPFRFRFFERVPVDLNVDPWQDFHCLNTKDLEYNLEDDLFANGYLSDLRLLRLAIERSDLLPLEKELINWKLLNSENIKSYPHSSESSLYGSFNRGRQKVTETFKKLKSYE